MYEPVSSHRNINMLERWFSMIGGGALTVAGLRRGGMLGFLLTLGGGYLAQRGLSGHCEVYHALGVNTAGDLSQLHGYSHTDDTQADQVEGKSSKHKKSTRVGRTPGSAEEDQEIVEADLKAKSAKQTP
ncbi:MAG: YgaP-like transmembrane domain [Chloroflexota bacterium]